MKQQLLGYLQKPVSLVREFLNIQKPVNDGSILIESDGNNLILTVNGIEYKHTVTDDGPRQIQISNGRVYVNGRAIKDAVCNVGDKLTVDYSVAVALSGKPRLRHYWNYN